MKSFFLFVFSATVLSLGASEDYAADEHESCLDWANAGECESNPNYMLVSCAESCARILESVDDSDIGTLYDVVETDIHGTEFSFNDFRGAIVYVVNVASQCGYTAENYEIFRSLNKYRDDGLVTVIAPCNQFGLQEPGDADSILSFAAEQQFDGIVLSKMDVNGPDTRPLFTYLKKATGKRTINWNFDGKFLCNREGECSIPSSNVEDDILSLLGRGEL